MVSIEEKLHHLQYELRRLDSVAVAYSGGVDSTLLLSLCCEVLSERVLAVTAVSATYPSHEMAGAVDVARSLSARHLAIETAELENPDFVANSLERCYHCKLELFRALRRVADDAGMKHIVDGSNYDDLSDYRPGMRAADEFGVRRPLQEVRLSKEEIRTVSRARGLTTWNKPSLACLASRLPYGTPITREVLGLVDEAESFLHSLGIGQLRLRHHGRTARIEVEPGQMGLLLEDANRRRIVTRLREVGYSHVTLDLDGYRTGSMNEGLHLDEP